MSPALYLEWYRTPSLPICLSKVATLALPLSRVFLSFSGGKSIVLVKKKCLHVVVFLYLRT